MVTQRMDMKHAMRYAYHLRAVDKGVSRLGMVRTEEMTERTPGLNDDAVSE